MRDYTVMLLYPLGISEGVDTYMTHIEAENAQAAGIEAQQELASAGEMIEYGYAPEAFEVLGVFSGQIWDINGRTDL